MRTYNRNEYFGNILKNNLPTISTRIILQNVHRFDLSSIPHKLLEICNSMVDYKLDVSCILETTINWNHYKGRRLMIIMKIFILILLFLFVFSRQNRDRMSDYLTNFPTFDSLVLTTHKVNCLRLQHTRKDSNKHTIRFILLRTRILVLSALNT